MSTSYGYRCVTDGSTSVTTLPNIGDRVLPELAKVRLQIAEVLSIKTPGTWLELSLGGRYEGFETLGEWLVEHSTHVLMLRDEYGKLYPLDEGVKENT